MATQLTPEQQIYLQGLADYESALIAQAQAAEAEAAEAQLMEAQLAEAQMLEAQLAGQVPGMEAHYAHILGSLLEHQAALQAAAGGIEEAYLAGMAAYEGAMLSQAQGTSEAASSPPLPQSLYLQGMYDYELELLVKQATEAAEQLSPEQRETYDQGRAAYERALAAQQQTLGPGPSEADRSTGGPPREAEEHDSSSEGGARRRPRSR